MLVSMLRADTLVKNQSAAAQTAMTAFPMSMLNLYGLVYAAVHKLQRPALTFWLTMALSVMLLAVCAWLARREQRDEVVFGLAVLCGLLLSYHMYIHDLTLLVLPLALLQGIRHYKALLMTSYLWPPFVLAVIGVERLFLVAPMLLWAVWLVARSQAQESESSACPEPVAASA